tara:strand:- start:3434 stop:4393 length:960 start_codon:yes stop_codon:yes gene_type:complete
MKKNIIITGGLGFIGFNLVKKIYLKKKFNIIIIDKLSYASNKSYVKDLKKIKNLKIFKLNIGDKKISRILKKYKPVGIFNLAAESHVDNSILSPARFLKSNIIDQFNFFESIKKNLDYKDYKLIHISTDEVFGSILNGKADENYPYKPSSPYSASKAASNCLVSAYQKTFNQKSIIINACNNFGPYQHKEKLIPKTIKYALKNLNIPIYGNGENIREWIYVEDFINIILKIFNVGKIGEIYNVGSDIRFSNNKFVNLILKKLKQKKLTQSKIKYIRDRKGHDLRYALNGHKLQKLIKGFKHTSVDEAIEKTIKFYTNYS